MSDYVEPTEATSDELRLLYSEAWNEGVVFCEYGRSPNGKYFAAAGSLAAVEELEKKLGRTINQHVDFSFADCMNLGFLPGTGFSRVDACLNAWVSFLEHQE